MKEDLKTTLPIRIAVRAIIVNDKQEIMLIKRALNTYAGGQWCLVGGKPDKDEELDEAAARETLEEIGTQLPLTFYAQIENPDTSTSARWITHFFIGTSNILPTRFDPREVSEVAFFSQERLSELDIAFDHKDVLRRYFEGK